MAADISKIMKMPIKATTEGENQKARLTVCSLANGDKAVAKDVMEALGLIPYTDTGAKPRRGHR